MLKNRQQALDFLGQTQAIRKQILDRNGKPCVRRFLEEFLPEKIEDFAYHVVPDLRCEKGIKRDASTVFEPFPRITFDEKVYVASMNGDPSSIFTVYHEGCHVIRHRNDSRANGVVALHRGEPHSGASFHETPDLETEANSWAGFLWLPYDEVTPYTRAIDLKRKFGVSEDVATRFLRQVRAVFPDRWRS